jgi:ADP-ribose pyrophosphatase YjhB (NUDIX family)
MDRPFPLVTVGGLLRDASGNVLLVRTRKWSGKWGIPGGKVELGETLEDAFRREIREETGLEILEPRLVMVQEAINHPEFHRPAHFVLINYVADVAGETPSVTLNDEAEEYVWKPFAEALGDMKDVNLPTQALLKKIENDRNKGDLVWAR